MASSKALINGVQLVNVNVPVDTINQHRQFIEARNKGSEDNKLGHK